MSHTPAAVLDAREKFSLLQQWGVDPWDLAVVNPHRQKFLARLGRKDPVQALRRMGPERRFSYCRVTAQADTHRSDRRTY